MNCKKHENIGKAMTGNNYGSPEIWKIVFDLRMSSCLVVAIIISDYQKLLITGKQGIFVVAKL